MFNKVMAAGKKVYELGVPVDVVMRAPTFSGGVRDYRYPYGGPESIGKHLAARSPEAQKRWQQLTPAKVAEVRQVKGG